MAQQTSSSGGPIPTAVAKAIVSARSSGNLNLNGRGLQQVPSAVYNLEEPLPGHDSKWWEVAEMYKVDLSRNSLSRLPPELGLLSTLTTLDVSHNQLAELPMTLSMLSCLKLLDVSNNKLQELPASLAALPSLAALHAGKNALAALPPALGGRQQPSLALLAAPDNRLVELPPGLSEAASLTKLGLGGNALRELPDFVMPGLSSLTDLDLSRNLLRGELLRQVGLLARVRTLNLRDNKLTALPPTIAGCSAMVELYLGRNQLANVPPELGLVSALKTLELRDNKITCLPPEICELRLGLLDLANNELRSLPPELGSMTSLRSLPLDGNPLKSIRREVVAGPISALLKHLASRQADADAAPTPGPPGRLGSLNRPVARSGNVFGVDEAALAADAARKLRLGGVAAAAAAAAGNPVGCRSGGGGGGGGGEGGGGELVLARAGLREVPREVWEAGPSLTRLDISGNQIPALPPPPDGVVRLPGLRCLLLNGMGLAAWPLPPLQGALPQLTELQVRNNPALRQMPLYPFVACPGLVRLELAGVPAAGSLPTGTFAGLTALEALDLSQTGLAAFPPEFIQLPRLRILNLSSNRLEVLPAEVAEMRRLDELNLCNNNLAQLPPQLGLLVDSLRSLMLEGNPLRTLRRPILERGTAAVLAYLKDRIPAQIGRYIDR
ncbi:hypothetical protein PLESTB_000814300 [Pleodorina starrii]|uniref:Uncharacterized protein n=1 Tax=Pleodorina starrii TaxID=330485 RepID=A0A9W6F2I8_9CHLO|nr:hypothetical protein PLESTM_000129900 [Pleodorina starrii]GLC54012.1 hypothetical protein PLESTB_000814300 [Pleodorina starrii]